jgi:O-antigen ligase
VHLSVVFSVAASAAVVFFNASPDTLKALGRDPTLTDRTEVWGLLLSLVRNPLLGTGFESFWLGERIQKIWTAYWWHPNQAHNGYLEVYLSLGWIGVTLLVVVLIAGYLNIIKGWRRNESTTGLMLAYFLVGIVYNFTEAAFFRMQAPAWIFLLFAITAHPSISGCFVRPSIQRVLQYPGPTNPDLDESTSHWVET